MKNTQVSEYSPLTEDARNKREAKEKVARVSTVNMSIPNRVRS